MYSKLLSLLLFVCQIIFNKSSVIHENTASAEVVTSSATRPSHLPSGYVEFPDVHAAYKVYEDVDTTWYQARDLCEAEGACLAITDSPEKIRHINGLKTSSNNWLHVGILHKNTTDQWVRIDTDEPLSDIPWIENNPDGTGDCAGIAISADGLVDYDCSWGGEFYVCQISI